MLKSRKQDDPSVRLTDTVAEVILLKLTSLCDKAAHFLGVLFFQRLAVLIEVLDERIKLVEEVFAVLHKEVRPHFLVHGSDTSHILEASAAEAAFKAEFGTLYVSA